MLMYLQIYKYQPIVSDSLWAGDIAIKGVQDNAINMTDIMEAARSFNSSSGDSRYNADVDMNKDNAVNMGDIIIISRHFNATSGSYPGTL
jgi:hypothetical protein